ncbi:alpha/beta hydrolase [Streptomyces fractus]|uniref:alpha/beta hydrolase n=1 Tax=Streptomyces fractus TaxID=641806 RepID=UPI003CF7CBE9
MSTTDNGTSSASSQPEQSALDSLFTPFTADETASSAKHAATFPLWPGAAPGSEDWPHEEQALHGPDGSLALRNVVVPTLTPYLPSVAKATGAAAVVAPGGGFIMLSAQSEGADAAEWLCRRGIAAFVLNYRLAYSGATPAEFVRHIQSHLAPEHVGPSPARTITDVSRGVPALALSDLHRALATVRQRAGEWHIDTDRVGVLGFSAGGYLATNSVLGEDPLQNPDFVAGIYCGFTEHSPVPEQAPPLFSMVAADDPLVFPDALRTIGAWQSAGRPVEAHVYADGGHGFGLNKTGKSVDTWLDRFEDWLTGLGLTAPRT